MKAFEYVSPTSVDGAVDRLAERRGEALALAGGMDLLGMMKDGVARPERLVDVKEIEAMEATRPTDDGGLSVGALVTVAEIAADDRIRSSWPALSQAAAEVGTPQIRNRGTLGGNLCQRPRCWYFRSSLFQCLRKGGDSCFAIDGDNRYHAVLDNFTCPIVHPSNCAVPLLAYDASIMVVGPEETGREARTMPLADFFVRPSRNIRRENVLEPDQLVTRVILPPARGVSATYVVNHKQSHDWPLALATAVLQMESGDVARARVVMGAVAPIPWRSTAAEEALVGAPVTPDTAAAAAEAALADATPLDHNAYKVSIARTAVQRAVLEAAGIDWARV